MIFGDQENDDYEADPELVTDLRQLFHDRTSHYTERAASLAELESASIAPRRGRVEYLLVAAAVLLLVGSAAGALLLSGRANPKSESVEGIAVAGEGNDGNGLVVDELGQE